MPLKRVLLTGATDFTGSHILDQFLFFDVSIRAVVGSEDEARALQERYASKPSSVLDFAIVPVQDLGIPDAYDDALSGSSEPFDTVIHTVTADPTEEADCLSRFINLEIDNILAFLRSVKEAAPTVRRVIVTSSLAPFARWLVDPGIEQRAHPSTPSFRRVADSDSEYILATCQASDNIVNDRLWKFLQEERPGYDLITLSAPSVYGPSVGTLINIADLGGANRRIWNLCNNVSGEEFRTPPFGINHYADVRDFALAHVKATFAPEAVSGRFVVSAGTMPSRMTIAEFIRRQIPEFANRIPPDYDPTMSTEDSMDAIDTSSTAAIIGMRSYRPIQETLTDLVRQLLELERRREWRRVIQG